MNKYAFARLSQMQLWNKAKGLYYFRKTVKKLKGGGVQDTEKEILV